MNKNSIKNKITTINGNKNRKLSILKSKRSLYEKEIYIKYEEGTIEVQEINVCDNKIVLNINSQVISKCKEVQLELIERKTKTSISINREFSLSKNEMIFNLTQFNELYGSLKARWDINIICIRGKLKIQYKLSFKKGNLNERFDRHILFEDLGRKDNNGISIYLTVKNELALFIDTRQKYFNEMFPHNMKINKFNMDKGKITFELELVSKEDVEFKCDKGIVLWRNSIKEERFYSFDVVETIENKNVKTLNCSIDIEKEVYDLFYWDLYLLIKRNNRYARIRIKKPIKSIKELINNEVIKFTYRYENGYILYPYITTTNCLSFAYRSEGKFEGIKYKKREKVAYFIYKVFEQYLDNKNIWLIYEKFSETAQDNSYFFYKYCCEKYPNKNIYYVINKKSPDYKKLEGYTNNVVDFMGLKHLIYLCAAQILVSSESKGHCYAWRVQRGKIKEKLLSKKMVFLQHGVTAMKRIDYVFKKTAANKVDLFVATSEYEKAIINKYFNYDDSEIILTGFSRWDVLEDKSKTNARKEIFLMPTWRNWLDDVESHVFEESNYFKNYIELLNSNKLMNILEKSDLYINYFVHPKFKAYLDKFTSQSDRINVIQLGEAPVNELLMRSSLLITDYSSVAFDMYYQMKPVLFYHFDIDEYNSNQGSYMDMESELFGDKAVNVTELIAYIEDYANNDFKEKKQYVDMRSKYFTYVDNNNSERVYEAITDKLPVLMKDKKSIDSFSTKVRKKLKKFLEKIKTSIMK